MKTHEVNAALRRFYKSTEYALMFEVGNTTGSYVSRHADAIAMNLWPSRGLLVEGIEVKVSRSDWRRELENPAKAEPIQKFCDQWWIVAPEGIVQEVEMPALWGLRVVSPNLSIRTVKMAPKLEPDPLSRGFVAAMLRRASEADAAEVDALVAAKLAGERASIAAKIESEVTRRTQKLAKYEEKIEKLKEMGIDLSHHYSNPEEFITAYKLGKKMQQNYTLMGLGNLANSIEKAVSTLREVDQSLGLSSSES